MKIKVYIMHSDKVNYKDEIYKPLLELGLMNDYYLILPMSNKYGSSYIKELLNDSDVVICDLTNNNIFLKAELKMAIKQQKEIYYFVKEGSKDINKYKDFELNIYKDKEELSYNIKNLLDSLNHKEILLKRENIFCLGKIQNNV